MQPITPLYPNGRYPATAPGAQGKNRLPAMVGPVTTMWFRKGAREGAQAGGQRRGRLLE